MLGDFYSDLAKNIDIVAERQLALGYAANGDLADVTGNSKITLTPKGKLKDVQVITNLTKSTLMLSNNLSNSIEKIGSIDVVSQDLLIGIQFSVDTYLWKLRSFSYN